MVWDVNVPAGSDRIRIGDDAIRELKVDVQTALRASAADGTEGKFPGSDTSNPVFRYRGLRGSTAAKPTPGQYGLYSNSDTSNLERDNGSSWDIIASILPVGVVLPYAGAAVAPAGFLLCNGAAVSRTVYAALFAVVGTAHGTGDGSTTFNVPDLRGRFVRFTDNGAGRDPDVVTRVAGATGGNTGDNVGSAQADAFKTHNITITDPGHIHGEQYSTTGGASSGIIGTTGLIANGTNLATNSTASGTTGVTATVVGGGSETRPLNVGLNAIIKY